MTKEGINKLGIDTSLNVFPVFIHLKVVSKTKKYESAAQLEGRRKQNNNLQLFNGKALANAGSYGALWLLEIEYGQSCWKGC